MRRKLEKYFESENEIEYEQLQFPAELLQPRSHQKLSAERTAFNVDMRSEYASTLKTHNISNNAESDDTFTLDDLQTLFVPDLPVCEDCTNCDNYEECFDKKGD